MSYKERVFKYNMEKQRMIRSPKFAAMTPQERDEANRRLAKKWKV